jgi:hypothetical protein
MTLTSPDVASLSESLSRWEIREYICAAFVAVACAGEYIAEFKTWFTDGVKERKERLAKRSTLLLIVSLSLELICLVRTNTLSGMLIGSLSEKVEEADRKAKTALGNSQSAIYESGEAMSSAHDASMVADKAQDKASTAAAGAEAVTLRMENASRKLGELEQDTLSLGPRWRLLNKGETTFVESLKPFAGQRVTVVICGQGDGERSQLEQMLLNFFPKAGWNNPVYMRWEGCPLYLTGGNDLYFVASAPSEDGRWVESYPCRMTSDRVGIEGAAKALCDTLNKLNISTRAFKENTVPDAKMKARAFWAEGTPGSPGEMAFGDPTMIFLVVGLNQPIFADEQKRRQKFTQTK